METHKENRKKQQAEAGLAKGDEDSQTLIEMKRIQKLHMDQDQKENGYVPESFSEATEEGGGR